MKYIDEKRGENMTGKCFTLGKNKSFIWEYNSETGITIIRHFKNGERKDPFSNEVIGKIINYVKKSGKVRLSNNVEKLSNGTEVEGLGKFVFDKIKKDTSYAQAMSQFAAIMVKLGIFEYNGERKSMEFWVINEKWQKVLISKNNEI